MLDETPSTTAQPKGAENISGGAWPAFVEANGGDHDRAKTQVYRLLAAEAKKLRDPERPKIGGRDVS